MADAIESVIKASLDSARESGDLDAADVDDVVDGGDEETVDTDATDDTSTEEETPAEAVKEEKSAPATTDEAVVDALMDELKGAGFRPRKGLKNEDNKIPYSQVSKITKNRETKAVTAVAKALGVDAATLKFEGLEAAITEKLSASSIDANDLRIMRQAEEVMATDEDRYIEILASVDPERYGKFLALTKKGGGKAKEETTPEDEDAELLKLMPEADYPIKLADGSETKTYSKTGLQKMFVEAIKIGRKHAREEAEGAVKPLKAKDERAQQEQESARQSDQELAELQELEGFTEHFDDILKALKEDTTQAKTKAGGNMAKARAFMKFKSTKDAYLAIVPKKLRQAAKDAGKLNEQELRKKWQDEMEAAAKGTSVNTDTTGGKSKTGEGSDPIEDAIRRSIKHLKR